MRGERSRRRPVRENLYIYLLFEYFIWKAEINQQTESSHACSLRPSASVHREDPACERGTWTAIAEKH
jgi:hypothetical protein